MTLDLNPGLAAEAAAARDRIRHATLGRLTARRTGTRGRTDLAAAIRDDETATRSLEEFRPHRRT